VTPGRWTERVGLARLQEDVARRVRLWAIAWSLGSLAVIALAAGVTVLLHWSMRSSGAYEGALSELRKHPAAAAALGSPIEDGWMRQGSIRAEGPSRRARLSIPVSGPKGTGMLYVEAREQGWEWRLQSLQLAPATGARIDLLAAPGGVH
jgi:hypothetical protein